MGVGTLGQGNDEGQSAPYRPLLTVLAAVISGIAIDHGLDVGLSYWLVLAVGSWLIWLVAWRRGRGATNWLLLAVLALAGGWHHCRWNLYPQDHIAICTEPGPAVVEGVLLSLPQRRSQRAGSIPGVARAPLWTCQLQVTGIRDLDDWRPAGGRCQLWIHGDDALFAPGQTVRIWGELSAPGQPDNPGEFDFYRARRGRRLLRNLEASSKAIEVLRDCPDWDPRWWLARLRGASCRSLAAHVGEARAGLAVAILLGERAGIRPTQADDFRRTGAAHLLAISGLHVGILAWGVSLLGRLGVVSRRLSLTLVVVFVVQYALLTSAQPPVMRAAILITVLCIASRSGKQSVGLHSLSAAAILVLLCRPAGLFQLGTQLSFLAVTVLFTRPANKKPVDPLNRLVARSRPWPLRWIQSAALASMRTFHCTLRVWLATAPLILTHFHLFAPIALVVNLLVAPAMVIVLFAGFGVLLTAPLWPAAADALGWCCDTSLAFVEAVAHIGTRVPGGHVWSSAPPAWWTGVFYCGLLTWILMGQARWARVALGGAMLWCCLGVTLAGDWLGRGVRDGELACTFLSVGHGTSVVMQFPNGQTWLYDAGRWGSSENAVGKIAGALWHQRIRRLDGVILSHADADHFNAVPGLLERFAIGSVYVSPSMFKEPSDAVRELQAAMKDYRIPIVAVQRGDILRPAPGVRMEVLHPSANRVPGTDNANSVVVDLSFAGRRILLPGDIEAAGAEQLWRQNPRDCDVLMAPHHGSLRSQPPRFLDWCSPEWVVISGGESRSTGAAERAYSANNAAVFHTANEGAVRVQLGPTVRVQSWKRAPW